MAYPQTLGEYRLIKRIARGGMGEVWSAEPLEGSGVPVAVKVLLSPDETDSASQAKFIGEARIGAALHDHPNIVKTLDVGLEGDRMFLVMELLDGRPLSELSRGVQLPPEAAVGIALPVLSALEHAQRAPGPNGEPLRLVHRDLKPGNLIITRTGAVKVIDFGIALASGLDQTTTRTGLIRGSIAFVSPEQARGERGDGRSDLYSLAVVMHELLTGQRLFDQESDAARLSAILFGEVPTVRSRGREIPEALDAAITLALHRSPAERPPDAAAFADALRRAIAPASPWGPAELARWAESRPVQGVKSRVTGVIAVSGATPKSGLAPLRSSPVVTGRVSKPSTVSSIAKVSAPPRTGLPVVPVASPALGRAARLSPKLLVGGGVALLLAFGAFVLLRGARQPATPAATPAPTTVTEVISLPEPPAAEPAGGTPTPPALAQTAAPPAPPLKARAKSKPAVTEPASSTTVHVTVDSRPSWANVSVDGKELGPTPLVRVPLPVSSHTLVAVSADGRKKTVKLKLVDGRDEKVLVEW
jgi:serine/threonine-protein kinase